MELCILGPLELRSDDGEPVPIPQPRQRAILSVLLLNAGQPVATSRLAAAVWGADLSTGTRITLRSHISAIRRLLAPANRLETCTNGYLFAASTGELDLEVFRRLAACGRDAAREGDYVGASRFLKDALDQWREPPLADVPETLEMAGDVAKLLDQRTSVRDEWLDVSLALGCHQDLVGQLRALVVANPMHEHTWAQLMLTLYRCGRQADALSAYAEVRKLLAEECGIDPGPELKQLQKMILAADASLNSPGPAPSSIHSQSWPYLAGMTPGAREQDPWQTSVHTVRPPSGTWPAPSAPSPRQLPADLRDFVGRADEISRLERLFNESRSPGLPVAVVSGLPGVGKTALALRVAHDVRHLFPDGQLYADLAGSCSPREPHEVLQELLRAIGLPGVGTPDGLSEMSALFRSLLADRRVLIVLDDAASRAQIEPLLPGTADCGVLVTSRTRLANLVGVHLQLGTFTHDEAVEALSRLVGAQRVAGERETVDEIISACDHLPLAVRVIGAKLAARPESGMAWLAERLTDKSKRLDHLAIGDLAVRASVGRSYQSLGERGRQAFRLLAVIGSLEITEWMIEALLDERQATDIVDLLIDNCLLTPISVTAATHPRFRLHRLVLDYALERLQDVHHGEQEEAFARLVKRWLEMAEPDDRSSHAELRLPSPECGEHMVVLDQRTATHLADNPRTLFRAQCDSLVTITRQIELGNRRTVLEVSACLDS